MPGPNRRLLLSIHDVGPGVEAAVDRLADLLGRAIGEPRFAMLVVPDHWGGHPLKGNTAFAQRLRDWAQSDIEMFVHGWFHRDASDHSGGLARFKARHLTAREGEFVGLSQAEAARQEQRSAVEEATEAQRRAEAARLSATEAQQYAEAARLSATEARQRAEAARQTAVEARQEAEAARLSATEAQHEAEAHKMDADRNRADAERYRTEATRLAEAHAKRQAAAKSAVKGRPATKAGETKLAEVKPTEAKFAEVKAAEAKAAEARAAEARAAESRAADANTVGGTARSDGQ